MRRTSLLEFPQPSFHIKAQLGKARFLNVSELAIGSTMNLESLLKYLPKSSRRTQFAIAVVAASLMTFGLDRLNFLAAFEDVYYDYWHQFAGLRRESKYAAVKIGRAHV